MARKRVKYLASLIVVFALLIGVTLPPVVKTTKAASVLTDISDHWAKEKITLWMEKGFVSGYMDGTFKPDKSITRAEFMTIVNKAFNFNERASMGFSDAMVGDWFYEEVAKAVKAGYISGYQDGTVKPNREISRQEAAVALCKALNLEPQDAVTKFTDMDRIQIWSRPYIGALVAKGYMSGYPDGSLKAEKHITRAETITMLDRVLGAPELSYDAAGIYGPKDGFETISGNLAVNVAEVTLRNMVIDGNLYLNEGIREGDVTLENVTVKGTTIIRGGGKDSIHLVNFTCEEIIVIKIGGKVRIVASGNTRVDKLRLESGANIEGTGIAVVTVLKPGEDVVLDGDFKNVSVEANAKVEVLEGTTINNLQVNSSADINLDNGVAVKNLTLDAPAAIFGRGTIEMAKINVSGAKLETQPKEYKLAKNVTTVIAGKEFKDEEKKSSGGGGGGAGGGGTSEVKVTGISVSPTTMILKVGDTATITATISPSNAENKAITWITSDAKVAKVDARGNVTAVSTGEARITAKTEDGGKTATCLVTVEEEIMKPEVDKSKLQAAINAVVELKEEDYTVDTWVDFETTLAAAQEVFADEEATQLEVDNALAALNEAIERLVEVEEPDPVASTYKFSYHMPEKVIAGEEYIVPVKIEPENVGDIGYSSVRFNVEVTTPTEATLQLLAIDTNNVKHNVAEIGYWGPADGFLIGADYTATTVFTAIFSAAGDYTITFSLEDLDEGVEIVENCIEVTATAEQDTTAPKITSILPESGTTLKGIETITVTASDENLRKLEIDVSRIGETGEGGSAGQWLQLNVYTDEDDPVQDSNTSAMLTAINSRVGYNTAAKTWTITMDTTAVDHDLVPADKLFPDGDYRFYFIAHDEAGNVSGEWGKGVDFVTYTIANEEVVGVTGVSLDTDTVTLKVYEEVTLKATIIPSNATNKAVTWASKNSNVATVDSSGTVKAMATGETIVIVTTKDGGYTTTCAVYAIVEESISDIKISGEVVVGQDLTASVTPIEATVDYQWQRADAEDGEYDDIDGATGLTYTLNKDDEGKWIRVKAIGKYYYTGIKISNAVGPVVKTGEVDKSLLQTAVDAALELKEEDYTEESWLTFQRALTAAEAVLDKEEVSQEEVDNAYTNLNVAIYALVKKQTVTLADIYGISVPVSGESPMYSIMETLQYSGSISWEPDHEIFQAKTVYTATITLTAKYGFTFKGVEANFFNVPGAISVTNDANTGVVKAVFPATEAEPIEGLVLHLDASALELEDGVSIAKWEDLSDIDNEVKQETIDNQPIYTADGLNGRPAVQFDGNSQYLNLNWTDGSLSTDSITMFLVLENRNMSGGSQTIMGNYDQKDEVVIQKSGSSPYPIAAGISTPIRDNRINFTNDAGPYILTYKYDDTSHTHTTFVNGETANTKTLSVNINWANTTIGKNGGKTSSNILEWHWKGDIAEIRIYNRALDNVESGAVEHELQAKWFGPGEPEVSFVPTPNLRANVVDGATVGTLSVTGSNKETIYSLVNGEGDTHNNRFKIEGDKLKVNGEALTEGTYRFRVKAIYNGNELENSFSITVIAKVIPGLVLHLDASTLELEDGVSIAKWEDLSDKGNDVSQNNTSNQPTFVKDGLNGGPVVQFDGEDDYLSQPWVGSGGVLNPNSITMFLVLKNHKMDNRQVVMGNYNTDNAISINISSQSNDIVARISDYNNSCSFTKETGPYVLTFDYDSSNMRTFVNGALTDTHSTNESISWEATAIGCSGTGSSTNPWKGDIAEIRIYNRALDDVERETVEHDLQAKWFGPGEPEVSFVPTPNLRANVVDGATVGILSVTGSNKETIYSLVNGEGDTHNNRFKIEGDKLKVNGEALTEGTYRFRVKAIYNGNELENSFSITVIAKVIPGLVLHLDASALELEDGVSIAKWEDLSDIDNEVKQETIDNQPIYTADGLNGRPAVRFDGNSQYLNLNWTDGSLSTDSITMFLVLENRNMSGGSQTIMGNYDQKDEVVIQKSGSSPYPIAAGISTPIRDNRINFTNDAGPYILTYKYDDTSHTHTTFVNGETANTKTLSVNINWANTTIGKNGGKTSSNILEWHWKGDIAEIRIYNRALDNVESGAVEHELQAKWFGGSSNPGEPGGASVLYNPYNGVNWEIFKQYKANFHTHTNQSDGSFSPSDVIDKYHNAGYKILALTDHDSYGYEPDTTWPWTKWGRNPEELGMLAIEGNEISSTDHISSLFNDYGGASAGQEEEALQQINSKDGLAIMNHPGRHSRNDQWYANLYESYHQKPLIGMEVYNQGDRYGNDRALWDRVNALVMPDITIFGYSGDDMHSQSHLFRNYQFMLMEELTEEDLRAAMFNGAFYFCYEPGGSGQENPPVPLISSIVITDNGTDINITATAADSVTWKTDKGEIGNGSFIDLDDIYLNEAKFIRAELFNDKGITYTQPFVLKYQDQALE